MLTINCEGDPLAHCRRYVVAGDAHVHSHLSSVDPMELQQRTREVLVLAETVATCERFEEKTNRTNITNKRKNTTPRTKIKTIERKNTHTHTQARVYQPRAVLYIYRKPIKRATPLPEWTRRMVRRHCRVHGRPSERARAQPETSIIAGGINLRGGLDARGIKYIQLTYTRYTSSTRWSGSFLH